MTNSNLLFFFFLINSCFHSYSQTFKCNNRIDVDSVLKNGLDSIFFQNEGISDECKLTFVNDVSNKFILSKKISCINLLSELFSISDGAYTDYICFNASKVFDIRLAEWFDYLYSNKKRSNNSELFIHCVSIKMGEGKKEEVNCNKAMDQLSAKLNTDKRSFLVNLRKKLNPNIQD